VQSHVLTIAHWLPASLHLPPYAFAPTVTSGPSACCGGARFACRRPRVGVAHRREPHPRSRLSRSRALVGSACRTRRSTILR
jgi:hypothetical protein